MGGAFALTGKFHRRIDHAMCRGALVQLCHRQTQDIHHRQWRGLAQMRLQQAVDGFKQADHLQGQPLGAGAVLRADAFQRAVLVGEHDGHGLAVFHDR